MIGILKSGWAGVKFGHFNATKRLYLSTGCILLFGLASCSSTKTDSGSDRAWMEIQHGMPKQEVYTKLGQPIRETDREAEWRRPEDNGWRVVVISFDGNGRVDVVRGHHEQK